MKIINHILENPNDKDFSQLLHVSMKDKTETISKSIDRNLTKPQADKMRICFAHYNIRKHISDIEKVILGLVQPYLLQLDIIMSLHMYC